MTTQPNAPRTFIIRLWLEPQSEGSGEWRGSVDFVQSGERFYFQSVDGLKQRLDLLLAESGEHNDSLPSSTQPQ